MYVTMYVNIYIYVNKQSNMHMLYIIQTHGPVMYSTPERFLVGSLIRRLNLMFPANDKYDGRY